MVEMESSDVERGEEGKCRGTTTRVATNQFSFSARTACTCQPVALLQALA